MEIYGASAEFRNNLTFNGESETKNIFFPKTCSESKNPSNVNGLTMETKTDNKIIGSMSIFSSNDYVKKETVDSSKIIPKEELELNKLTVRKDHIVDETYFQPSKLFILNGLMMPDQTSNNVINNTFSSNHNVKIEPADNSGTVMKKELEINRELTINKDYSEGKTSHLEKLFGVVNTLTIETQTDNKIRDNSLISNNCVKMEVENNSKLDLQKELGLNTELIIKEDLREMKTGDDRMDRGTLIDNTELNPRVAESQAVRNKKHQCPICRFRTNFVVSLASHMETIHRRISNVYRCRQCGFKTFEKIHFRKHNCSGNILVACLICEFAGESKDVLSEHIKNVHHMIACPYCLYYSWNENDLSRHSKVHHPPKRDDSLEESDKAATSFECKQCGLKTDDKRFFQLHVSRKHVENDNKQLKWFKCPHCDGYQVVNEDALNNHILRNHSSDVKLYTCVDCKFDTRDEDIFHHHMASKHQPKYKVVFYYICKKEEEEEEEEEEQSGQIQTDQRLIHCPVCSFETGNEDILAFHISFYHKGYFIVEFECYHCNFKSHYKFGLYLHKCLETTNIYSFAYCFITLC